MAPPEDCTQPSRCCAKGDGVDRSIVFSQECPPWEEFHQKFPDVTIFHSPRWGHVMRRAYDNEAIYVTALRGRQVVGTLTLVLQHSAILGSRLCSIPYFDTSGIVADTKEIARQLVEAARQLADRHGAKWAELRQVQPLELAMPVSARKVTFQMPLPHRSEALWESLRAKIRNRIRKAQRQGLLVYQGRHEMLDFFYDVYARNMRDLGSPPHSRRFLELTMEEFYEHVRIFVVCCKKEPLAAGFTLMDRHTMHVPWAGSDWRRSETCANMLLYWSMMSNACDHRLQRFDFGRCTVGSGTYDFKHQWGGQEQPLYWHYVLGKGRQLPDPAEDNALFQRAARYWRRLPVAVSTVMGPRLIAKLS